VYPYFQVEPIAEPIQGTNNQPIYNASLSDFVSLAVLPSGGKYEFQFDTKTFLEITLTTFLANQTNLTYNQVSQVSFYQQETNSLQPITNTNSSQGYQIQRQDTETIYIEGDSFTIDTTNLSDSEFVIIRLPTILQLQVGIEGYNSYYNANVETVYPTTTFFANTNIINPQGWVITSPYGIQYTVGVVPTPPSMYTIGYDYPDIYGNTPEFTINGESISNSVFNSTPTIPEVIVPQYPYTEFSSRNPIQMTIGEQYNYGNFISVGYADGLNATYPVFFKERVGYSSAQNSNGQYVYFAQRVTSLRKGKNGMKLYGLWLGSQAIGGYTVNLMANPYSGINNNSNPYMVLQSTSSSILVSMISGNVTTSSSISTYSTGSTYSPSSQTATSQTTTTQTTTTQTTTTNVNKTTLTLSNLFTNPIAVLIIILALIGVVLFVTV
jgi:hypothetical protein